MKTIPEVRSFT